MWSAAWSSGNRSDAAGRVRARDGRHDRDRGRDDVVIETFDERVRRAHRRLGRRAGEEA
jgi:hypothetical protein